MRSIPMSKAGTGDFRVAGVLLPSDQVTRLNDLGLRPGGTVTVLQNRGDAGAVIGCGDARLALDAATAARILLAPVEGE